jgi:transposase
LSFCYEATAEATTGNGGTKTAANLDRYKRRWIVERTNAGLGEFRRLLVRHEHLLSTYYAFFYLACFWITLRRYS